MLLGSGGNSAALSLGFRIYLRDEFTPKVAQLQASLKGYKQEFLAFQENLRAARNVSIGIAAASGMMLRGLGAAVREGAQFGFVMKNVGVIADATTQQLTGLSDLAKELGRQTMMMPEDVASGMRFMAMAGQDALQIMESMPAAVNLAGVAMIQLGGKMGAADILTNHLKAYGWAAERATHMSDILTEAVTSANVSLIDLGNSVRYVAATSRNVGVPMEQTTAMLMTLGNAGIQASMAGTALENMMRYLTMALGPNATKRQRGALDMLGLSVEDLTDKATGGFLRFDVVLTKIKKGLLGYKKLDAQNIVKELFGVRGQRGGMTLMRNIGQVTKFMGQLQDPSIGGSAGRKMHDMMDTLEGDFLKLTSSIKAMKASLAKGLGPILSPWLRVLKGAVGLLTKFADTKVGKIVLGAAAGLLVLAFAVNTLKAGLLGLVYMNRTLTASWGGMMSAAKAGIGMNFFGRNASNLKYSKKGFGGSHIYTTGKGTGARFVPTSTPGYKEAAAATKQGSAAFITGRGKGLAAVVKNTTPVLARVGMGLRGILGVFGGVPGILMMLAFTVLPHLIDWIGKLFSATKENTEAIKVKKYTATERELFGLMYGANVGFKTLADRLDKLIQLGVLTPEKLDQLMEIDSGYLSYLMGNGQMLGTNPVWDQENSVSNPPKGN